MNQDARKPMLTPLEAVSIKAQRAGGEPWLCKQVAGSNPAVSTSKFRFCKG